MKVLSHVLSEYQYLFLHYTQLYLPTLHLSIGIIITTTIITLFICLQHRLVSHVLTLYLSGSLDSYRANPLFCDSSGTERSTSSRSSASVRSSNTLFVHTSHTQVLGHHGRDLSVQLVSVCCTILLVSLLHFLYR